MKEYIVTLSSKEHLDSFYHDMEEECWHVSSVPTRRVDCAMRRSISRNTHYLLDEGEAEQLKFDKRVLAVEAVDSLPDLVNQASQFSIFNRGLDPSTLNYNFGSTEKNWALYRNFIDANETNWGSGVGGTIRILRSISWDLEGEDVDLVINDTLVDPDHPEYAVNSDGTGGSRVQVVDWADYDQYSTGGPAFWKSQLFDRYEDHGSLCASTAAGNTHGLARKSNIYAINSTDRPKYAKFQGTTAGSVLTVTYVYPDSEPIALGNTLIGPENSGVYLQTISSFGTGTGGVGTYNLSSSVAWDYANVDDYFTGYFQSGTYLMWDRIRAFHRFKNVNPTTNRRNPTVVNASYGFVTYVPFSSITSVNYRGTLYNSSNTSWTADDLYANFGLVKSGSDVVVLETVSSFQADIEDAIADGITIIHASGNSRNKIDVPSGDDYDNYFTSGSGTKYYHRGGVFSSTDSISSGNLGSKFIEEKDSSSCSGPRIDVWAGGEDIIGTAAGTRMFGQIVSYSVTNNVVTFNVSDGRYGLLLVNTGVPFRVKIEMTSTTAFNGYHDIQSVPSTPTSNGNPSSFTINFTTADVSLTTEAGTFVNAESEARNDFVEIVDSRDETKFLYAASGTSFSAPMTAGLVACWIGYFGRLDRDEFKALMAEHGAQNRISATGSDTDYDEDSGSIHGAVNTIQQYVEFRPTTGFCYPQNTHKARSTATQKGQTTYQAFPRQRVLRYGT